MSEFSLDDILDKYSNKSKSSSADADDILNDILGEEAESRSRRHTNSLNRGESGNQRADTEKAEKRRKDLEIKKQEADRKRAAFEEQQKQAEEKRRAELAEKQRIAEEKKLAEKAEKERLAEEKRRAEEQQRLQRIEEEKRQAQLEREAEQRKRDEEERKRKEAAEKEKNELAEKERLEKEIRIRENNDEIKRVIEEKDRRERIRKRKLDVAEKQREREEAERIKAEDEERAAAEEAQRQRMAEQEEQRQKQANAESEWLYATKSVMLQDVPIEMPSAPEEQEMPADEPVSSTAEQHQLEKVLRQQKIEIDAQKLLIKETELEDPDDFLNAMNPYEFGKKAGYTQQIETIPSQQLSGDTRKVDPEELRELSVQTNEDDRSVTSIIDGATRVMPDLADGGGGTEEPDTEEIKEFIPKSHDTKEVRKHTEEEERLIRSINDTMEQKRLSDIRDTNPMSEYNTGPFDKIVLPTRTAKFESEGNKVLRTGEIPMSDPAIAEQKLKELASKRKRRISNFVLEDISDDEFDYEDDTEEIPAEEEAAGIWTDLVETHKSLRLRSVLLFIVTALLVGANILQQVLIRQRVGLFGNELGFLGNDGIVFANLICGVVGMALCSSVITSGLGKIFRGRADCDSICAASCVLSLAAAVLQLVDTNDMQQSRAFIYIPVALIGLMFNSVGKLSMIKRAKKNYRFMTAEGSKYYAEVIDGQSEASAFTKGVVSELPYLVTMRKTELLTEFLKKSYCEDMADRVSHKLVPVSLIAALVMGVAVYFIPTGHEVNGVAVFDRNIYWSVSVAVAVLCAMSPFSMMFVVNNPFRRASKQLIKNGCALLGYTSAEEFGEANSVLADASTLFPKSAVECTNIKPCKLQNSLNNVSLDMAIILAASLAIKSGSVLSGLFFDMIGGNKEMIANIDGCVYEDNLGVMGWYGNKRIIMGSREHMKQHSIKIPEMSALAKYSRNGSDCVYLAVGGELAVIFFIRLTANPVVRASIKELTSKGVSVVLKTTDSLITVGKIADLFDVDPEKIKIIGASLHDLYNECTRYTAEGSGAMSCSGSFVSLANGITSSKKLLKDVGISRTVMLAGVIIGVLLMIFMAFSANTIPFMPEIIAAWHIAWLLIMLFFQMFRRY